VHFTQECPSADNSPTGVGIAFDGTHLWYSCYNTGSNLGSYDLFEADTSGFVLKAYRIAGGLGAIAYDGIRKDIWAGWGGGDGGNNLIRLIDPNTGSSTVVFTATSSNPSDSEIDDGLAYNAQDDSLYISPDTSTTIYHYTTTGSLLDSFNWAGDSCHNSGVAIGGQLLFEGADGCNHIYAVDRTTHQPTFDFGTGSDGVRDEGLACDSVTFSPKTVMWSIEAYSPRRAIAYEIPSGSCVTGGAVDSDGDGIPDDWEKNGVYIVPNGGTPVFINLPAMGADPNKPDVFVQLDWMQDQNHNQKLNQDALCTVIKAFANSGYHSPTGSTGINLHVDEGPDSLLNCDTGQKWGSLSQAQAVPYSDILGTTDSNGNYDWSAFQTLKDRDFTPTGRTPIFHYTVAAHQFNAGGNSGLSRSPANIAAGTTDFIVSLGTFDGGVGSVDQQTGTFMHELGHNLGLGHGGADSINYKPNYLSVMNYLYQLSGVPRQSSRVHVFDYSHTALLPLDENHIDETAPIGEDPSYGTQHYCAGGLFGLGAGWIAVNNVATPIDWNCNGETSDLDTAYDVNGAQDVNGNDIKTVLYGYDDWDNLRFNGNGTIGLAGVAPTLPITTAQDETLNPALATTLVPVPSATSTPVPSATGTAIPSATNTPVPSATVSMTPFTVGGAATPTPGPTITHISAPTLTVRMIPTLIRPGGIAHIAISYARNSFVQTTVTFPKQRASVFNNMTDGRGHLTLTFKVPRDVRLRNGRGTVSVLVRASAGSFRPVNRLTRILRPGTAGHTTITYTYKPLTPLRIVATLSGRRPSSMLGMSDVQGHFAFAAGTLLGGKTLRGPLKVELTVSAMVVSRHAQATRALAISDMIVTISTARVNSCSHTATVRVDYLPLVPLRITVSVSNQRRETRTLALRTDKVGHAVARVDIPYRKVDRHISIKVQVTDARPRIRRTEQSMVVLPVLNKCTVSSITGLETVAG